MGALRTFCLLVGVVICCSLPAQACGRRGQRSRTQRSSPTSDSFQMTDGRFDCPISAVRWCSSISGVRGARPADRKCRRSETCRARCRIAVMTSSASSSSPRCMTGTTGTYPPTAWKSSPSLRFIRNYRPPSGVFTIGRCRIDWYFGAELFDPHARRTGSPAMPATRAEPSAHRPSGRGNFGRPVGTASWYHVIFRSPTTYVPVTALAMWRWSVPARWSGRCTPTKFELCLTAARVRCRSEDAHV